MDNLFQKQQYWKYFARSKLFHPHKGQQLVHARAPSVLLFLIGNLQVLKSSCQKCTEILILRNSYIYLIKYLPSKAFHPNERQKLVHAGATSILLFLIGKLQDLASSSSKLIEILIFWNSYLHLIKYLPRSKVFHPNERQKLVHAGTTSVLLFLIGKLQDLASSTSKLIEILIL